MMTTLSLILVASCAGTPQMSLQWLPDGRAMWRFEYEQSWALCVLERGDAPHVVFEVSNRGGWHEIEREKIDLRAGLEPEKSADVEYIFANRLCEKAELPADTELVGVPGKKRGVSPLPLRARVVTQEAVTEMPAPIEITAYCNRCGGIASYRQSESVAVRPRRVEVEARISDDWYECAHQLSTLELRFFVGDDDEVLRRRIRPDFVLEGLHRKLSAKQGHVVLDMSFPIARLCASTGNRVAWEWWGRGELKRFSGGGRRITALRCP